jgi:hypothetical protein
MAMAYLRPASDAIPAPRPSTFPRGLLSLSDAQLEIVMLHAHPIAPAQRGQFLAAVAQRLAGVELGDGVVSRCCRALQREHFTPPDVRIWPMAEAPAAAGQGRLLESICRTLARLSPRHLRQSDADRGGNRG